MNRPRPTRRPTNELTSLLLVFPIFLIYQVGVLALPSTHNGADLITSRLLTLLHGNLGAYLGLSAGLLLCFVVAVLLLRRTNDFSMRAFVPVLLESGLYAVTMGSAIVFVMTRVLHIDPSLSILPAASTGGRDVGLLGAIVLSCGAGLHEELVFRLMLLPLLVWVASGVGKLGRGAAIAVAVLGSSLIFSAAHHVIGGEPWQVGVFVYRTLCGLIFAALFWWRGFAVDVYTHTLYDIFVLLFR
jgi:hypothetical protein